ncbi:Beta-arrestin-1 [Halocaridina rubra]|uniref:Beta-arrestin-1 n=1 Tax=Halocaridina rubra TaxID=373956 RepID=A0AAN8WIW4_HALRR
MVVKFQVYKKSSPNNKVTIYLTKRDFIDHVSHVDTIEGVLVMDPNYVQDRNVYVQLGLIFRFGRDEEDALGYNFVKTMYLDTTQLYPPVKDNVPTEIQRNLISRLGNFAFAFKLDFPKLAGPSYTLMQGWEEDAPLISVEYEVMGFVGTNEQDMHTRSSANLIIRRVMECPSRVFDHKTPEGFITKSFLTCSGTVTIEASLSSPVYFQEEEILVKVNLKNHTSREIKRLKVKLVQLSEIPMFSDKEIRDKTIMKIDDPISLAPGSCTKRSFTLVPIVPAKGYVYYSHLSNGSYTVQFDLEPIGQVKLVPTRLDHLLAGCGSTTSP